MLPIAAHPYSINNELFLRNGRLVPTPAFSQISVKYSEKKNILLCKVRQATIVPGWLITSPCCNCPLFVNVPVPPNTDVIATPPLVAETVIVVKLTSTGNALFATLPFPPATDVIATPP